jgi:hypothetical protein
MPRAVEITVGKYSKNWPAESAFCATNCQLRELLNKIVIMTSVLGTLLRSSAGCGKMLLGNPLGRGGREGVAKGGTESNVADDVGRSGLVIVGGGFGGTLLSKSEETVDK